MSESHSPPYRVLPDGPPPRRLTSDINKPDYHPCCLRVGVRVNGVERNDITEYNQDTSTYRIRGDRDKEEPRSGEIEVYWRYEEARQERRYRERWEREHGRMLFS